jgi:hypothetical protein
MKEYPEWLRKAASKGGKKSRRKLSKKEARRIAMVRWAAGAGRGVDEARRTKKGKAPNAPVSDGANVEKPSL